MQLLVNNKEVSIDKVSRPDSYGYCSVYINDYQSHHSIPKHLLDNGGKCVISGNTYQVKL